jgi:hypothetical protein
VASRPTSELNEVTENVITVSPVDGFHISCAEIFYPIIIIIIIIIITTTIIVVVVVVVIIKCVHCDL